MSAGQEAADTGWLGCGKKRRKSKDIRDYGEVISQASTKGLLRERRDLNRKLEEQLSTSDFLQPSLKNFFSKPRRLDKPKPSKLSSPSNRGSIPVSVFSSGMRKKVSPSSRVSKMLDSSKNSQSSVKLEMGSQRKRKKRVMEDSDDTFEQDDLPSAVAPPLKKMKSDGEKLKIQYRSKTYQDQTDLVMQQDVKKDVQDNRMHPIAEGEHVRGAREYWDYEEDKENWDPKQRNKAHREQVEAVKNRKCLVESEHYGTVAGSGRNRKPLSEITVDEEKYSRTKMKGADVKKSHGLSVEVHVPSDGGKEKVQLDLQESETSDCESILEPVEGLYMDTNELLAELSYCEKMSV